MPLDIILNSTGRKTPHLEYGTVYPIILAIMKTKLILFILIIGLCFTTKDWAQNALNVKIIGVDTPSRENIIQHLNRNIQFYENNQSDQTLQNLIGIAPETIKKALEPFGYFKPDIQSNISINHSVTTLSYKINPGPPIKINHLDIKLIGEGKNNLALKNAIAQIKLKEGDIFQTQSYENAKNDLFQIANNQGYIKAFLEKKEVRINLQHYSVSVSLYLNTGPQFYLGEVTFENNPFDEAFLKRFMTFKTGEPFSSQKLLQFQQDLSNSHYFKEVSIRPDLKHINNGYIPIRVYLNAPKSKQISIGIGYGTITGPRFTARTNFRRINSTGDHFSAELNITTVLRQLAGKYFIPGSNPITDQYTIGASIQKFTPANGQSFSETLSAGFQKKKNGWNNNYSLNFLNEQYQTINLPDSHSQLLYPAINFSQVKADDLLNPHNGSSINLILQGGSKQIISATNFIQGEAKVKYIFSPFTSGRVILKGDLGYTVVNNLDNLPLSMQFFAGGTNSIRGYPDSKFGPGRYLELGSFEYQHQLIENWSGAIFYDVGTASNHFGGPFNVGDGAGIIYHSFIGPIRFYISRAESRKGKPLSFEISLGTDL